MSAGAERVDVLAVLDAGIKELRGGHSTMWTARDVAAMRDAVRELALKAASVADWIEDYVPNHTAGRQVELRELRAALARVEPQP